MNRSIAALLVCTVFLLATHGINAFESDSSELTQLLAQAEQGDVEAQFDLGWKYYERIDKDSQEASRWLLLAAEQGNAEAQFYLGSMYLNGYGVAMDEQEGVKWLSLAANQGDQMAMNSLSHYLDFQETMEAAEQGDADAQFRLAEYLGEGHKYAGPDDFLESVKWFQLAAEQRHAEAQFQLGRMYENGEVVAEDKCEALKWYREAAERQHEGSLRNLGSLYSSGIAVDCDVLTMRENGAEAIKEYSAIVYGIGWVYYIGDGIATNRLEATKLWRLAAEHGDADAQFYLGWMYDQGIEFAEDDCEAGRWYWMAVADEVDWGGDSDAKVDASSNLVSMWYEYNEEGVAIPPDCEWLAFLKDEKPTFE